MLLATRAIPLLYSSESETQRNNRTTQHLTLQNRNSIFTMTASTCFFVAFSLLLNGINAWTTHTPSSLSKRHSRLTNVVLKDKQSAKDMIDFIDEPMDSLVGDEPASVPPERDELADLVRCVVRAADGRKAEDITAMRVSEVSTLTSFVIILCGNSRPQNQAIAAAIKDDVQEEYDLLPGSTGVPEGDAQSGWIVLDYGSVMVHVMTPKSRLFYNVEGQWKDRGGEYMDISDVVIPNTIEEGSMPGGTMEGIPESEDPFWS